VTLPHPWNLWPDPPRRWQEEALDTLYPLVRQRKRVVLQAATGTGKTRLQLAMLEKIRTTLNPGWILLNTVPKQDLVEQTVREARKVLGAHLVGAWYGKKKELRPIVVCCHDSMGTLADRLDADGRKVAFWLADEGHKADTEEVLSAIERLNPVTRLMVTATPFKTVDTDALRGWDAIGFRHTIDTAMERGDLVGWRFVNGYGDGTVDVNVATVQMIRDHAPAGPGLVTATDCADADWFAEVLRANGITAEAIHTKVRADERKAILARHARGQTRVLVHVDLLTEGVDMPYLRWLAFRAAINSSVRITQQAGRGLRTCAPDQWGHKREFVILLPRFVPVLAAAGTRANLSPSTTARELREAAERELADVPNETSLGCAVAAVEVSSWVERLVLHARAHQVEPEAARVDPADIRQGWRTRAPTDRQLQELAQLEALGHKSPFRYLPGAHRDVARAVVQWPETLTAGTASDLLGLLYALRRRAAAHVQAHAHLPVNAGKFWNGLPALDGEPPAVKAPRKKAKS